MLALGFCTRSPGPASYSASQTQLGGHLHPDIAPSPVAPWAVRASSLHHPHVPQLRVSPRGCRMSLCPGARPTEMEPPAPSALVMPREVRRSDDTRLCITFPDKPRSRFRALAGRAKLPQSHQGTGEVPWWSGGIRKPTPVLAGRRECPEPTASPFPRIQDTSGTVHPPRPQGPFLELFSL